MITGSVVSTNPSGWKPSRADRLPSWKIQTRAPKLATMDSVFITSALIGRTTDRSRTNRTRNVVMTMNAAVRGKSAHTFDTTSSTSAAPPPTRIVTPAGGARRARGVAQLAHEGAGLLVVGPVGRRHGEGGEVALRRRPEGRGDEPVRRARRGAVQELVLLEREALVEVHVARHAADPRVGGEPARVVVQRGHVRRGRGIAGRADGDDEGRELALAELPGQDVVGLAGRHRRGEDRGVRGVEPDVEERNAQQQQERQRRDQHGHRVAHDASGEAGPRAVRAGLHGHLADAEPVDPRAEDREDRRQEGEGRGDRQPDHDRPGDAHRAQDHELEQDEAQEAEQHGEAGEEHGPARGRDGHADGLRHAIGPLAARQLLAEAARHQERVVHAQAEAQQRGQVEHEDAHRDHGRHDEDAGERHQHRRAAHGERHAGGDQAAEDDAGGPGPPGAGRSARCAGGRSP